MGELGGVWFLRVFAPDFNDLLDGLVLRFMSVEIAVDVLSYCCFPLFSLVAVVAF